MSKRSRRKKEKLRSTSAVSGAQQPIRQSSVVSRRAPRGFLRAYDRNYKKLLIIPLVLLILAFIQIGYQTATTGDFVIKGLTLKGGMSVTIPNAPNVDPVTLQAQLTSALPGSEINVRILKLQGVQSGVIIETDQTGETARESMLNAVETAIGKDRNDFAIEDTGSQIGERFFKQILYAMLFAFVLMGFVVVIYFKKFIPSVAIIMAAFSDIVITMAIANILGIKMSTAGIAAFLMLIGYSVDSDMLLTTKLLKRKEGSDIERIMDAMKTGLMMTGTTIVALIIALMFSESLVITQIMEIILIGLFVDLVMTWIQNVGILRWYIEKTEGKGGKYGSS